MKHLSKNKRGDIPVTILVIGVVAICMMALLSFYFFDGATKNDLNSVGIVEKAAVTIDKISLYENSLNLDTSDIDKISDVKVDSKGRRYIYFEGEGISVRYNLP